MRIPYVPRDPSGLPPKVQDVYMRIEELRKPYDLTGLDLALLHNVDIADGFYSMMTAVRAKSSLPAVTRELAMCYVGVLNGAVYEWSIHSRIALQVGVRREVLEAMMQGDRLALASVAEDQRDVLEFTYQSTINVKVEENVIEKLKSRFTAQQMAELTMTVASYNMVSRFLVALDVTESNDKPMAMPSPVDAQL